MTISVRNVDEELFKEFQIEAKRRNMITGEAMNEAIRSWMRSKQKKPGMLAMKTWNFGAGTENLSQEVDEVLYGKGHDRYMRDRIIRQ